MARVKWPRKQKDCIVLARKILKRHNEYVGTSPLRSGTVQKLTAKVDEINEMWSDLEDARDLAHRLSEKLTKSLGYHKSQSLQSPGTLNSLFRSVLYDVKGEDPSNARAPQQFGIPIVVKSSKNKKKKEETSESKRGSEKYKVLKIGRKIDPASMGDKNWVEL